jgi:hypothetical protein
MVNIIQEKQHARLSPSAAKRWMTCPGSIAFAIRLALKSKPSKYAAEGTAAHEIHELCLLNNRTADYYLGETITADGLSFKVNDNMADAVGYSLSWIRDTIVEWEMEGYEVELRVEVRCSLKSLEVNGLDGGTSDVVLLVWDEEEKPRRLHKLIIFDYKHGQGVAVDPENNPQAMSYALGTLLIPELKDFKVEGGIEIVIGQPRAHHPDGRFRTWETSKEELLAWQDKELIPKALATMEENAPLVASEDGCRFCECAPHCPKLLELTEKVAMLDFEDFTEPSLPEINQLNTEQKLFILENCATIKVFLEKVEQQVQDEVEAGSEEYSGSYKLVRKQSRRKFTEDALDEISSPLLDYLEYDDIYEQKPRSLSEIERRLKKATGWETTKEVLDNVTTKPEGGLTLTKVTDKREEVESTASTDFKHLTD